MRGEAQKPSLSSRAAFTLAVRPLRRKQGTSPRLTLRFTEEEMNTLRAASAGQSLSEYVRKCLFSSNAMPRKARTRSPVSDQQALARVLGLLGKSGLSNSLETLAHEARAGSLLLDEVTYLKIHEAHEHVCAMRDHLVGALGLIELQDQP